MRTQPNMILLKQFSGIQMTPSNLPKIGFGINPRNNLDPIID